MSFSTALCIVSLRQGLTLNLAMLAGRGGSGIYFSLPTYAEVPGTEGHAQLYKNLSAGVLNSGPPVFIAGVLIH